MVSFNPFSKPTTESDNDERIAKRADGISARDDRALTDRNVTENREISDSVRRTERRAMLRDTNTLLPPPPEVPGYHSFWATTTNSKDTVETRMRAGYSYITRTEAANFEFSSQKSGDSTNDRVMINEMVAMKIPLKDWHEDMLDLHYEMPKEQMLDLKNKVQRMSDGRGKQIGYTGIDFNNGKTDGFEEIGKMKRPTLQGIA